MNAPVSGLNQIRSVVSPKIDFVQAEVNPTKGINFSEMLVNSLSQVNQIQNQAQMAIGESVAGGDITQVEVMSSVKKADLSLRMLMQVRNKLLEAFNEIKQMQM